MLFVFLLMLIMMATTTLAELAIVVVRPLGNNAFLSEMLISASTLQEAEEDDSDRY